VLFDQLPTSVLIGVWIISGFDLESEGRRTLRRDRMKFRCVLWVRHDVCKCAGSSLLDWRTLVVRKREVWVESLTMSSRRDVIVIDQRSESYLVYWSPRRNMTRSRVVARRCSTQRMTVSRLIVDVSLELRLGLAARGSASD